MCFWIITSFSKWGKGIWEMKWVHSSFPIVKSREKSGLLILHSFYFSPPFNKISSLCVYTLICLLQLTSHLCRVVEYDTLKHATLI
jgi:hypothetical protein